MITNPPKIASRAELLAFLNTTPYNTLRPLGKVVAISNSILRPLTHWGLMQRKRVGSKADNKWK